MLQGGQLGDYSINEKLGHGSFGQIFTVQSKRNEQLYAAKVEPVYVQHKTIDFEAKVLKDLKALDNYGYFPKFISFGRNAHFSYLVMELLGPSLTTVLKRLQTPKFSLSTGLRVAYHMLKAIEIIHRSSYVHRDIKPANILIRLDLLNCSHPRKNSNFNSQLDNTSNQATENLIPNNTTNDKASNTNNSDNYKDSKSSKRGKNNRESIQKNTSKSNADENNESTRNDSPMDGNDSSPPAFPTVSSSSENENQRPYKCPIAIIDFGLARYYIDPKTNRHLTARSEPGFRGTLIYASIHAHLHMDLSRRDDLISWFYVVTDFLTGGLPWRSLDDREEILKMKQKVSVAALLNPIVPEMTEIWQLINLLRFDEKPDYERMFRLIEEAMEASGIAWSDPYDWAALPDNRRKRRSSGGDKNEKKAHGMKGKNSNTEEYCCVVM
ncbi:hypothetical protein TRFO_31242 [Tritrichomonas foetus]|uniref:non-specific serine/threonine protein kinase n=1 Tax=Tritrichomonas foetus TaxID=1144522 RepID=A0A1J4JT26_9EUKA|nr:hypothetical protein TRFO_31242 [Tritrichomonas foetus]|eukprot:OHT01890.1 hypothetical protein TRFO_31242 [Tritrichomonas foetus]